MTTIVTVRGTGEAYGSDTAMCSAVLRELNHDRFPFIDLDYPASIGPKPKMFGPSESESVGAGIGALSKLLATIDGPVGLIGYSLGALVVSRFVETLPSGVAFVGLIANPLRRQGDSVDNLAPDGFGIAGQRTVFLDGVPWWEIASPEDGITNCPGDSPLRTIADQTSSFTFADLGGWSDELVHKLLKEQFQKTWQGETPKRVLQSYLTAVELLEGYLAPPPWNTHTGYSVNKMPGHDKTWCQVLAELITAGDW